MTRFVLAASLVVALAACDADDDAPKPDAGPSSPLDDSGTDDGAADDATSADAGALDAAEFPPPICTSCGACSETFTGLSGAHVAGGVDYPDPPPAGGSHDPCWKTVGIYDEEVEDERWVHNLEHGDIVLLHNCADDCAEELDQMTALATDNAKTLMSPYAALPARFAIVAWGHRLVSDCYDAEAFAAFYTDHVDRAPESISQGPNLTVCAP